MLDRPAELADESEGFGEQRAVVDIAWFVRDEVLRMLQCFLNAAPAEQHDCQHVAGVMEIGRDFHCAAREAFGMAVAALVHEEAGEFCHCGDVGRCFVQAVPQEVFLCRQGNS